MIKASLVDKATGTVFGRVSVRLENQLDVYKTDTVDVILGWDDEVQSLNPGAVASAKIRAQRDRLLDTSAWTIRADSPLSATNQAQWLAYLKQLQRLTVDYPDPNNVVWPEPPAYEYGD